MDGVTFTKQLLAWYDAHARDLPWRQSPAPYAVWISEIMAQQTQIDRVIGYFERWMNRYPDLLSLAQAHEEDVLKLWEGLGYYSRARNILKTAHLVVADHGGVFPSDIKAMQALPGVGEYTAGAIASIAFGQTEPAVDANVLRVFSRLLDVSTPVKESAAKVRITKQVRELVPDNRSGDFNQAIMELGALICSKTPSCGVCPVQSYCSALANGTVSERPVLAPGKKVIRINMVTGILVHEGRVLIQKRRLDDVWPGLWEFPGGGIEEGETPEQAVVREYQEEVELDIVAGEKITVVTYSYTRYRVTMHCYLCRPVNGDCPAPIFHEAMEGNFVSPQALSDYAFPAGHRRLIEFMRTDQRFGRSFFQD